MDVNTEGKVCNNIEMQEKGYFNKSVTDTVSICSEGSRLHLINGIPNQPIEFDDVMSYGRHSQLGSSYLDGYNFIGSEKQPFNGTTPVAPSIGNDRPFTVECIDDNKGDRKWFKKTPKSLSALKLILAIILAGVTLASVLISKFTVLSIASRLNKNKYNSTNKFSCNLTKGDSDCERETALVMLCIIMMVPPCYTLVKMFIFTCRKITHPWPTKLAILWVYHVNTS